MKADELLTEAKTSAPFTEEETAKILKVIEGFEAKGRHSISAQALGFKGEEHELPGWIMDAIRFSANGSGKSRNKRMTLSLSQIYAQDQEGVSIRNLRTVLEHWATAPLPEVLALPNGYFWLIEGHHRLSLQRLAGRSEYEVIATYDNVYRSKPNHMQR